MNEETKEELGGCLFAIMIIAGVVIFLSLIVFSVN